MHWTLCVVSGENKTIQYYNSMSGGRRSEIHMQHVLLWVGSELGSSFHNHEWHCEERESPQQTNSDDCGVFTITTARQIMLGQGAMSYDASDIQIQRKRVVAEIVNGGLLKAGEWLMLDDWPTLWLMTIVLKEKEAFWDGNRVLGTKGWKTPCVCIITVLMIPDLYRSCPLVAME